jgi:hypothetical protein
VLPGRGFAERTLCPKEQHPELTPAPLARCTVYDLPDGDLIAIVRRGSLPVASMSLNPCLSLTDFETSIPHGYKMLPTYHLSNYMELSPSCQAVSCAATLEFSNVLWNSQFHYRIQKSSPLVSILNQINTVSNTSSSLSKIHFNFIHPYRLNNCLYNYVIHNIVVK